MLRLMSFIACLAYSSMMWAINCYYTLVKDNCWTNYNVTVNVIDAMTNNVLITVTVPTGKSWVRQAFNCQPSQKLKFSSQFSPTFWQGDQGRTFVGLNYISLPDAVNKGDSAWNVPGCFSADFAQVPLPPTGSGQCACDLTKVPPIPPQTNNP